MVARHLRLVVRAALSALCACAAGAALSESIIVSNYGVAASAMPYAVALAKGYFKESGADVDAIVDGEGEGAVHRLVQEGIPYGELSPASAAAALRAGADVRIVSGNVNSVAGFAWVALPSSPINSVTDLRGTRLGYSNTGATTDVLNRLLLAAASIAPAGVTLTRAGGLTPELTYLEIKGIDVAPIPEPLRTIVGAKYRTIATAADALPPMTDVVGVTTGTARTQRADFIRGVLRARRKAIAYMHESPADAARLIAAVYKSEPADIERAMRSLIAWEARQGEAYWDPAGTLRIDRIEAALHGQALIAGRVPDVDLAKLVDMSILAGGS